jgi:hypothetical protein
MINFKHANDLTEKILVRETSPSAARRAVHTLASSGLLRSCVQRHSMSPGSRATGSGLVTCAAPAPSATPSSPAGRPDG